MKGKRATPHIVYLCRTLLHEKMYLLRGVCLRWASLKRGRLYNVILILHQMLTHETDGTENGRSMWDAKMSIDPKFVELTTDGVRII